MPEKQMAIAVQEQAQYKNKYIILGIVLTAVFMGVLDTNVVNVALPTITTAFGVELSQSQWVVTVYLIVNTSLLLIFGRLSEYTGKVRLFFAGIAIFTIGSLACGLSGSLNELIFFRIIQGMGASIVYSINTAILVQAFPRNERGRTLGLIGTIVAIGSIAGPILGGLITGTIGWQYIFFINVPVGIILLLVAAKYLKLKEVSCKVKGMDWVGAAALILTMVSLMMLLGDLAGSLTVDTEMLIYACVFFVSLAGFVFTELNHENPIIDLRLFKVRKFTFASLSTMINFTAFSMFILSIPFLLQYVWDYTPEQIGMMLLAVPLVTAVVAPLSGYMYDKLQSTYHSSFGMLVTAIALFVLSFVVKLHNPLLLVVSFGFFGLGTGMFTSPNNTEIMSSLPMNKSSTASSMLATVRNFGNAIGVSLASIILYLMLSNAGFASIIEASVSGKDALANSISVVLFVGGALCVIGVITSLIVGWSKNQEINVPAACDVAAKQ
ncbi:MAG TPA: MFS transporter [Methanocella sp.]|uniref:MFS transporter n=1 Tax=Methanocella sp. TaxID=2052833 RepID=UPI002CE98378|nr:MFS transporter [Methanocella sp.]HTY91363.1 MFS transporter [Methanocella sp.]